MASRRHLLWLKALLLGIAMIGALLFLISYLHPKTKVGGQSQTTTQNDTGLYTVVSVIDGDTFKIIYNGEETSVRLIGINTPESINPRGSVDCYGEEASEFLKNLLTGKQVRIETDPTQEDRDKYDRLLRYVYLDGEDVGLKILSGGYGYLYVYDVEPEKYLEYRNASLEAKTYGIGLWSPEACREVAMGITKECNIKGNISFEGEKIYHLPWQEYYDVTEIDPSYGERWFCSEEEAQAAGWRKSKT